MAKNHSVFITINNEQSEYVKCLKAVDDILSNNYNFPEDVEMKVFQYAHSNININKLEVPLDGKDIGSSISLISEDIWGKNIPFYFDDSHIHIRIKCSNANDSDYLLNLHYLTLMLYKLTNAVNKKRVSVFLVPRSGEEFPFNNNGETDTNLYQIASSRLRVFIGKENQGIIYGVNDSFSEDNHNIVNALDFSKISSKFDCFPVIYLNGNINAAASQNINSEYLSAPKSGKEKNDITFKDSDINNLNYYLLLFKEGTVRKYWEQFKKTNRRERFGFANSDNPKLALVDYVFEVSAMCFADKLQSQGFDIKNYSNENENKKLNDIAASINQMSFFTFAIFSFILAYPEKISNDTDLNIFINVTENYIDLANEISSALNQLIQNSLQHSEEKICMVSFLKTMSISNSQQLKIIISDLGNKTIIDTFCSKLKSEIHTLDNLQNVLGINYEDVIKSNQNLIDFIDNVEIKNFFNEFNSHSEKNIELWQLFRQNDSSAHIGLGLFSNTMKRCNASYCITTSSDYSIKSENTYSSNYETENSPLVIPGTEFKINIPIKKIADYATFSMSQLSNGKYFDNYESYAKFLNYNPYLINTSVDWTAISNAYFNNSKEALAVSVLDKFTQQLILTKIWLSMFDTIKNQHLNHLIICLDFQKINFKKGYLENSDIHREVVVKGFVNAIGIFSNMHDEEIYFAMTNLPKWMIKTFKDVLLSLSIKKFPENLQLFICEKSVQGKPEIQLHLVGSTYGEAIQNAFVLSIENGSESFGPRDFISAARLCEPFKKYIFSEQRNKIFIAPFTMFITDDGNDVNNFFKSIKNIAENELIHGEGYKISRTHTRLGNKVHTNAFFEMSFLFYRTSMANRVAFEILKDIINNQSSIDILNDTILFYGYASYSQAILTSLTNIVRIFRNSNKSKAPVYYAVYQYNLQSEADRNEITVYLNENNFGQNEVKIVQIVPISSTLTTFEKMWVKFKKDKSLSNYKLALNYSVIWVRDDVHSENKVKFPVSNPHEFMHTYTDIEKDYYIPRKRKSIETNFKNLKISGCRNVNFIISTHSVWQQPELCLDCYPQKFDEERPLIETDPTSTVPSQQINLSALSTNSKVNSDFEKRENLERILKIRGNAFYGHYKRGKNHFQIYIDTINYFAKVENDVKNWLINISSQNNKSLDLLERPCQNVIFSPEHNTNVGFSQYVNAYYFNGNAEIISLNEDKEFRSNFICEHAALKNTIEKLFEVFGDTAENKDYLPVKFYFVDDNIITGTTLHKASSLLQSLIPEKYLKVYSTNVFEKCFFLIDRLSNSSKISYVQPIDNFISFCHINISNTRIQGDSCTGCKLLNEARRFAKRSTTNYATNYWSEKVYDLTPKVFESINDKGSDKHYYMLALSHMLKELFALNRKGDGDIYFIMIADFFAYLSNDAKKYKGEYEEFFSYYSTLLDFAMSDKSERKTLIECLFKIISRPFFTFNYTIKAQVLKFIILVSEAIIKKAPEKKIPAVTNLIKMYSKKDNSLLVFFEKSIFNALTDLHSTYLIRKENMKAVLEFTNQFKNAENFWINYAIFVQKIIDGCSDESRCLWLEYLIKTGHEMSSPKTSPTFIGSLYDTVISEICSNLTDESKNNFKMFTDQIFIGNGRILYDREDKNSIEELPMNISAETGEEYYFLKRWNEFIKLDLPLFKNNIGNNNRNLLFQYLSENANQEPDYKNQSEREIIKKRYDGLLKSIYDMIVNKYSLSKNDVRIAILTGNRKEQEKLRICDLDVVSKIIVSDHSQDFAISKYIIKERIAEALSDSKAKKELENNGYYICTASDCNENEYNEAQQKQNHNDSNHRKPYIILRFCISDKMCNANPELKHIIPVYMYISVINSNSSARNALPSLIVRDILINKNRLNKFFVADFTSDVLQRYSRSIGTEAILKTEKEISHSSIYDDYAQIKFIFSMGESSKNLSKEKMLEWFTVRNYCNTLIARLHNRVMRNFNKTLDEIISDSDENYNVLKLYVQSDYNDGFSIPLTSLTQILPFKTSQDCIFKLFGEIIHFEGLDELNQNLTIVSMECQEKKYTYNADYTKNLIYRICFDALRFSRGACAENNDFAKRIINHYSLKNLIDSASETKDRTQRINKIRSKYTNVVPCYVEFSVESSTDKDFDWLVIKNKLDVQKNHEEVLESIKKRLTDPLDFSDGHMSLIAQKEFLSKLFSEAQNEVIIRDMYSFDNGYFVTRLPIISKQGGSSNEKNNNMDR